MIVTGGPLLTIGEVELVQVVNGSGQPGNICLKFSAIFSGKPLGFTYSSLFQPQID
jgi:hypothetical protein